jgi:hypothetical protein
MNRRLAVVVMLAGFVGAGVAQTAKPNFAGTWKLNLAKSDLGQMAPTSETNTISQTADTVTVAIVSDREQGKMTYSFPVKLDGTDTPVPADAFPADSMFKLLSSKAEWVGGSLVITQTTTFQDTKGTLKSTFTLSDDGKTLTKATHIKFDQGEFDSKSVYDKV